MITIKLSEKQLSLLINTFRKEKKKFNYLIENNLVYITENECYNLELIIDVLSNHFMKYGLQKNDEPNQLGFELETLTDIFLEKLQNLNV